MKPGLLNPQTHLIKCNTAPIQQAVSVQQSRTCMLPPPAAATAPLWRRRQLAAAAEWGVLRHAQLP